MHVIFQIFPKFPEIRDKKAVRDGLTVDDRKKAVRDGLTVDDRKKPVRGGLTVETGKNRSGVV